MGILAPLHTCTRVSPACLELQLLLSGAEGMLHLVLGNGLPLPRVFLEDMVPDDRNLVGRRGRRKNASSLKKVLWCGEKAASPGHKKHGPPGGQAEAEVQRVSGGAFGYMEGKDPLASGH